MYSIFFCRHFVPCGYARKAKEELRPMCCWLRFVWPCSSISLLSTNLCVHIRKHPPIGFILPSSLMSDSSSSIKSTLGLKNGEKTPPNSFQSPFNFEVRAAFLRRGIRKLLASVVFSSLHHSVVSFSPHISCLLQGYIISHIFSCAYQHTSPPSGFIVL